MRVKGLECVTFSAYHLCRFVTCNLCFPDTISFQPQTFVKSLLLYSYSQKVSGAQEWTESLRKKLNESEQENTKLKETLAKQDEELLILGKHSSVMQCEASVASMARD